MISMSLLLGVLLTVGLLAFRLLYVFHYTSKPLARPLSRGLLTLIVLGSGGHTAEMLNLIDSLDKQRFYPRVYIAALTDNMSLSRAATMEEMVGTSSAMRKDGVRYVQIYRSREVGQSYITSILTTIIATFHALWLVFTVRPDIILCNGPGTCVPLCVAGFLLKVVGIKWVVIVYAESIARVRRLSLSGLILYKLRLADKVYVQWTKLQEMYPHTEFVGRLM
ncbi:hypothetical protein GOP47_0029681 [Adiantum capillus-veneris]|nr:hypothetical protein GOP47_0029681 [Adiantum capillus-veneris]